MGTTVLHRLNGVELHNVVAEVLGAEAAARLPKIKDPVVQSLDTNAEALSVSPSAVDSMFATASTIAEKLDPAVLGACAAPMDERACATQQISRLVLKLLRRPATKQDIEDVLRVWDDVRTREPALSATRAAVQRLLLSPEFLYHVEIGDESTGRLDNYAMASRLSFALWESAPDDELYAAAAMGILVTKAGVKAQVERMLADPRAHATLLRFFAQWADLAKLEDATKDPAVYPNFETLRPSMRAEFQRFVTQLLNDDGTLPDLLTSRTTPVDAALAQLYGVQVAGGGFQDVTLPPERAGGILTQSAFLSVHGHAEGSAPILRGIFVRERLLCAPVPPPPPGVSAAGGANVDKSKTTTRQYFAALTAAEECQGCHSAINGLGFAFENFDGIGGYRVAEKSIPVDTRADVTSTAADDGTYAGAAQLLARLAQSDQVRDCIARFWFRSRFRRIESGTDERVIAKLTSALRDNGDRLSALAASLVEEEAVFWPHFHVKESR